jgi:hypothetical protein
VLKTMPVIAAANRCATQNRMMPRVFQQTVKLPLKTKPGSAESGAPKWSLGFRSPQGALGIF